MKETKRFYLSGPISGLDREQATRNFARAAERLREMTKYGSVDVEIVNPLELDEATGCEGWADYIIRDLEVLKTCDVLVLLNVPGRYLSTGCEIERMFATHLKKDFLDMRTGEYVQHFRGEEEDEEEED